MIPAGAETYIRSASIRLQSANFKDEVRRQVLDIIREAQTLLQV